MRIRNTRLRTKITALLVSLAALWAFAAWVTLREGLGLLSASTIDQNVTRPMVTLVTDLQEERKLSAIYLSSPGAAQRQALVAQRARVDASEAAFRDRAVGEDAMGTASGTLKRRIRETAGHLDAIATGRKAIDSRSIDRQAAVRPYNEVIDSAFRVYNAAGTVNNEEIARDSRALNSLTRAKEMLSREDTLLSGALAAGRLTPADHAQFVSLVGTQRYLHEEAAAELPSDDLAQYQRLTSTAQYKRLRFLEDYVYQGRPGSPLRVKTEEWRSLMGTVLSGLEDVVLDGGDRLVDRAKPVAVGVVVRLVLAGGLGLLAVIASVVVSITTARALMRQLERLRAAAWELAERRLPGVVERLGHGEQVDVATEAPPLEFGTDEIGQVGRAFNAVQETAIRTAVEQAELRRGIRDVLLSLARRTQTLVHRQLTMLDTMERRHDIEAKDLEELFRLDHLATRMRRNAENLIVLSGALPARGWRNSVPMVDVVRAAVGEVEDYTRVTVLPFGPLGLAGRAVGDVTHLLAELIENAVSFSPPDTVVQVSGNLVANGFAIDIEDRGLGMTDERLAEINERIADPPEFNLQSSVQLGLYVVSRLAGRYGLQVSLKRSAYGGTTAVVVIPKELVVEQEQGPAPAGARTRNGLEVRRPAAVGAPSATPSGGLLTVAPDRPAQPSGPALVAVPPPASEPAEPAEEPEPEAPAGPPAPAGAVDGGPLATTTDAPTSEAEDQSPVAELSTTPSGLPVRVPQANLAEPLRAGEAATAEAADGQDDPGRSPEEIKQIMGSYQRGTQRGRTDAAGAANGTAPVALGSDAEEGEEDQ
ncbi:nitrate- and nitrite sensing domain-containing protein [Actinomadura sp. NEAU-AAG7]|uniref:sensor histidine kinase n=1 Tax=Actinomadura sp. NEAU-AAG7 TaxID=2839640 RepID=UPI001BE40827|nr:nitrate- and nitrite sensing domain-containing protein [Actinomadura sp. NEAU-AAG7]MBT2210276.1 nitrate- and nitrite sensing domain-containing protein [Actinomadura sp. NEAU-AAG7]